MEKLFTTFCSSILCIVLLQQGFAYSEHAHASETEEKTTKNSIPDTKKIKGVVKISPSLKSKLVKNGVLYIYARDVNQPKGMPLAVKRIDQPELQKKNVKFELTSKDQMIQGMPFKGPFRIVAKYTTNGDAMQKKGALQGEALGKDNKGIKQGDHKVTVTINEEL